MAAKPLIQITHHLPGRLRVSMAGLRHNQALAGRLAAQACDTDGIRSVSASPLSGRVLILYDAHKLSHLDIAGLLAEIAEKPGGAKTDKPVPPADRLEASPDYKRPSEYFATAPMLYTLITGGVLAGLVAKRLLIGRSPLAASKQVFNLAAFTTIVSGYPILQRGLAQFAQKRRMNPDLIISVTTLVLLAMRESISGLSVLWIVYLNNLFQSLMQARTRHAIQQILRDKQWQVKRSCAGRIEEVPLSKLKAGDIVVVHAGERIPVDGVVVAGKAAIDQSAVSGNCMPVSRQKGDTVMAGTSVRIGAVEIKAEKVGGYTSAAAVARAMEDVLSKKTTPFLAINGYSSRLISLAAGIAAAVLLLTRDFGRSLAVLLAGCPAAVALACQAPHGLAVAKAARKGMLVKNAWHFQTAGQVDAVLLDKTGTLTSAVPQMGEIVTLSKTVSEERLLALAAAAEQAANHPLARMLVREAEKRQLTLPAAAAGDFIPGYGVQAVVGPDKITVGGERLLSAEKIALGRAKARALRLNHLGHNVLYVAVNGKLAGLIGIRDTVRPESRQAIEELRAVGVDHIGLITGDTLYSAETVAGELGITVHGSGMLPENKVTIIRKLQEDGHRVMMVGDGINDSPALAAADLGVALGSIGAASAIESADIIIAGDDLRKIAQAIKLSRETDEVVRRNLSFTIGLNALGVALAATNIISPLTSALLQYLATIGVVANSTRLLADKKTVRSLAANKVQPPPVNHVLAADNQAAAAPVDLQRFAQNPPDLQPGTDKHPARPFLPLPGGELAPAGQDGPVKSGLWHTYSGDCVCDYWQTSPFLGLAGPEAAARQKRYGPNALTEVGKPSFWARLAGQFKDFMVQVLLGAAGLSVFIGKTKDAVLTLAIVVANAFLGASQESRAEQSIASLQKLAAPTARIIRGGRPAKIRAEELVPGDVIILESGDKVPADARLITVNHFEVEEASLTGEPIPVKKNPHFAGTPAMVLGDRKNMVFMGTSVTRGRATAVVVATGMKTEMGKIATLIQNSEPETTPLQRRLEELGKYLVYGCLGVSGVIFAAGLFRGQSLINMLQTAASLAVAAIPEGLAAIVVIALAMGVQRMAKRNVVIRKLSSLETLGCANVICSDKTGTLTKNEMTVRQIYTVDKLWQVSGEGYLPKGEFTCDGRPYSPASDAALLQALLTGALCNNARLHCEKGSRRERIVVLEEKRQGCWRVEGDPTEGALLVAAAKAGLKPHILEHSYARLQEIPFESERRLMSVVCRNQEKTLYCKGAPDTVLAACTHYLHQGRVVPLEREVRAEISRMNEQMAGQALRMLATAYRPLAADRDEGKTENLEEDLIFCGLIGMIDPPRPEVPAAIAKCRQAGIKVVMITGDHPRTAQAIARELGLLAENEKVVVGQQLDHMSDGELAAIVEKTSVYARTAPQQKLRIVRALKQQGYVVAMTGDGVNDAPAVKTADIGIAMGLMGTDVTKEAACMTLSDDNFATIVGAIEEGRSIYANIRKAIRYLVATNIGEVILMLMAVLIGLPLPLLPLQLLWINLVGDGLPALALVNDPPARDVMRRRPCNASDNVLAGGLGRKVITRGLIIGLASLGLYAWELMTTGNLAVARTLVVAQLAISQFFHLFDCRIEKQTGKVGLLSNWPLVGAVALSVAMIVGIIHWPVLQPVFSTVPLGPVHWLLALAIAAATSAADLTIERLYERFQAARDQGSPACGRSLTPAEA